jgi:hypothetical protein
MFNNMNVINAAKLHNYLLQMVIFYYVYITIILK